MKKIIAPLIILIASLLGSFSGHAEEFESVSIQLKWFHQFQFAGYYAAKEKGFFAEEGLDVDLREHAQDLDPIVEVTSGRAQYGVSDSGLLLSRIQGEPVVLVSQIFQHSPVVIVALRQSGLRTPYNLADKSVMTYLQGHGDVALQAMVLQTLGDIDSVKWVEHTYRNQDVLDGKVDAMLAYITNEPFWFHEKGADISIIDPRDFGIDLYGDNLFTSEEEKQNHPERLEKVQRAVLKGWKYALDHSDEVIDLILREYNTQNKSRPYLEYEARQTAELVDIRTYQLGHYEPSRYDKIAGIYQRLSLANKPETPSGFYLQDVRTDGEAQTKVELTDDEIAWIKAHPVFRIAATPDWPPFEIREEDGAYSGISADFIRMAAHKVGLKPEPHFDKWRLLVEKLKNRELDVAPGLNETEDRKEFLAFSNFFVEQYSVIFTTNDHNDIKTMDDLDGKTVVVEKGYALAEILARDYPAIKLVPVSNSFEAIQKVSLKEADAYVGNQVVGSYLTKKNMITNVRTVGFYPGKHGQLRFGIRSDWPILRDILNKGLAAITTDERNTILTTYIDVDQGLRQRTVSLTDEERTWVEAHPVIRVASDPSFPPLEFRDTDGNVKGYSADLLAIAAKRIGVTVESVEAFDRRDAEDKVRAGKADVLGVSVKAGALAKGLIQTNAYQTFPSVIIVPNSQTGDIGMESLSGKKVAVVAGWPEEVYLREHYPGLDLQTVSNSEIGLNKLAFGDFDAFVTLLPNASHVIQEQGITSLRVGGRLPITFSYAFATRADMPVLARLLDKATASISQEEEKELLARWISLSVQEGLDIWTVLKWGGGIGGGALLIITIIVTWNRRLGAEIEQRKKAEAELHIARDVAEEATRVAEEATKAKATFLATMSHEIRTPMGGVIGMVDLLQQSKMTDDQRQMINTVGDSAHSLLTIINDILDFSKIEAGKLDLEEIPISIRDVVEGAGEALAISARNKNIGLSVFVDPGIPDALVGDQVRLRQILFNFGTNAIKFTEKGKVFLRADMMTSENKGEATVRFQVIDDGIGIPEEAQKKLFQAFSQVDASTTRKFGGTGLGLTICQRLTEIMNGEVGVESVPGEGSTFSATVTFPVAEEHAIKSDGHDLEGLNILLAHKDDEMRGLNPHYLEHWKATVTATAEIHKVKSLALDAAKHGTPFEVICLGSGWPIEEQVDAVRSLQGEKALSSTGYVVACRNRVRADRPEIDNTVYVDAGPLRRAAFIKSVAVAAGRASPEVEHDDSEITLDAVKAPTVAEAEAMGQLVLLAEDNVTNQDVIRRQLTMLGYAVEIANDGKEALELLQSRSFAILLTDCHMPNMDGFELTESIRKSEEDKDIHFPIVAVTASVMKEEVDQCFSSGMDDFIAKPMVMKKLKEKLYKWMPVPDGIATKMAKEPADKAEATPATDKPSDAVVNVKALTDMFGDDEDMLKEILGDYVQPSRSIIGEIDAGFEAHDADAVGKAAHKLKSSSRAIGANSLADLCDALELAGKANDWGEIEKLYPDLHPTFDAVITFIEEL